MSYMQCPKCGGWFGIVGPQIFQCDCPPKRFSFSGVKRKVVIDDDIWQSTQQYVKDQIAIMKRHGSDPGLTEEEFNDLAYTVAEYPQTIRNLQKKAEAKLANNVGGTGTVQSTPTGD